MFSYIKSLQHECNIASSTHEKGLMPGELLHTFDDLMVFTFVFLQKFFYKPKNHSVLCQIN